MRATNFSVCARQEPTYVAGLSRETWENSHWITLQKNWVINHWFIHHVCCFLFISCFCFRGLCSSLAMSNMVFMVYVSTSLELVKKWLDCGGSTYRIYSWNISRRLWDNVHSLSGVHTCRDMDTWGSRDTCFMCHLMISGYQVFVLETCRDLIEGLLQHWSTDDLEDDGPFTHLRSLHPQKYHSDLLDHTSSDGCLSSNLMSFLVGVTYMWVSLSHVGCHCHLLHLDLNGSMFRNTDGWWMEILLRHLLELHLGIRHTFAKHHKVWWKG